MADNLVRAIFIDPALKQVRIVKIVGNAGLKPFYDMINCNLVEMFQVGFTDDLVIFDEEGIFNQAGEGDKTDGWYCSELSPNPIAGKTVIVGDTKNGKYTDVSQKTIDNLYKYARTKKFRWAIFDRIEETYQLV